jgi:hypothetical protein
VHFDLLGKEGQHFRIDTIRLGEDVVAAGKVADLAGIDDGHEVTGGQEFSDHIGIKLSERLVCAKSGSPFRLVG